MKCIKKYMVALLVIMALPVGMKAQNRLGTGFSINQVFCFTGLSPRLDDGAFQTSPDFSDMFNFSAGLAVDYQMEMGLAFTLGAEFRRNRFGFHHEGTLGTSDVSLWGHSEFYSFSAPLTLSYIVFSNNKPRFDIAPFIGGAVGLNLTSYRNLTRLDENYDAYSFSMEDYSKTSLTTSAIAGVNVRTIISQLGVIHWGLSYAMDVSLLEPFNYTLIENNVPTSFSQGLRMSRISIGATYFFTTWEAFDGRLIRRRFN